MPHENPKQVKFLIAYFGFLQTLHLLALVRAGVYLFFQNRAVFPLLPPPGGWTAQTQPFLVGLGVTDSVGILLGMLFALQFLVKKRLNRRLGVISLTVFITGAIVFAIGTFAAGAWVAHPIAYSVMGILFIPTPFLLYWLLVSNLKQGLSAG